MKLERKIEKVIRFKNRLEKMAKYLEGTCVESDFTDFANDIENIATRLRIEEMMKRNMYQPIIDTLDKFMNYRQIGEALDMTHESVIYHMSNLFKLGFVKQEFPEYRLGTTKKWIRTVVYLTPGDIKKLQAQNSTTQNKLKKGLPLKADTISMDVITEKNDLTEKQTYGARTIYADTPYFREKHRQTNEIRRQERNNAKKKVYVGSTFDLLV